MRKLTLIIALLPTLLYAQCEYSENKIDEFTGDTVKVTKPNKIAWGTRVTFYKMDNKVAIGLLYQGQIGCVTSKSYVIFKYVDGTTETIHHVADINCQYPSFIGFVETSKQVEKIRIRFDSTRDIDVKDKDFLIDGIACVN